MDIGFAPGSSRHRSQHDKINIIVDQNECYCLPSQNVRQSYANSKMASN